MKRPLGLLGSSRVLLGASLIGSRRHVSNFAEIREELLARPKNIIHDYLTPTPSHLLSVALADFLPSSCLPREFTRNESRSLRTIPAIDGAESNNPRYNLLPQGHHLVYFPTQTRQKHLLPDGTDVLHFPGAPFTRRMWAGGAVYFDARRSPHVLALKGQRAVCVEGIRDVTLKGKEGDEKIFVQLERRMAYATQDWNRRKGFRDSLQDDERLEQLLWTDDPLDAGFSQIVERRDLVFMREKTPDQVIADAAKPDRVIEDRRVPDVAVTLRPDPTLLFRFSALTFNAHAIHLDPQYARQTEGHRNLLVHGPLSLVLMISVLKSHIKLRQPLKSFEYRNLAPLYADEEMTICIRQDRTVPYKYDVWVLNKAGSLAIKGTAYRNSKDAPDFVKWRGYFEDNPYWYKTELPTTSYQPHVEAPKEPLNEQPGPEKQEAVKDKEEHPRTAAEMEAAPHSSKLNEAAQEWSKIIAEIRSRPKLDAGPMTTWQPLQKSPTSATDESVKEPSFAFQLQRWAEKTSNQSIYKWAGKTRDINDGFMDAYAKARYYWETEDEGSRPPVDAVTRRDIVLEFLEWQESKGSQPQPTVNEAPSTGPDFKLKQILGYLQDASKGRLPSIKLPMERYTSKEKKALREEFLLKRRARRAKLNDLQSQRAVMKKMVRSAKREQGHADPRRDKWRAELQAQAAERKAERAAKKNTDDPSLLGELLLDTEPAARAETKMVQALPKAAVRQGDEEASSRTSSSGPEEE